MVDRKKQRHVSNYTVFAFMLHLLLYHRYRCSISFTVCKLQQVAVGCKPAHISYAEIGEKMKTTQRSIEGIRDSLFKKLDVRAEVVLLFVL